MNADRIPMTIIALDDGEPIGTAALTDHDMETHRELSPWLGGVYVVPAARGRGVARALVGDVIARLEGPLARAVHGAGCHDHGAAPGLSMSRATPEEAFTEARAAMERGDWEGVCACLDPETLLRIAENGVGRLLAGGPATGALLAGLWR
jgi:GNAT superfamily N-acetyltransferase